MGDRCYLELRLRGRIETPEHFEEIVDMLKTSWWQANDFDESTGPRELEIAEAMVVAFNKKNDAPCFYLEECNYADISEEEAVLQEIGLPYEVSHEEGGDYGAGAWSWSPERGKIEVGRLKGEGASVPITDLENAMKSADPLAAIQKLIDTGNAAEGCGLPGFSLSDAVLAYLGLPVEGVTEPATTPVYVHSAEGI